MTTFLAKGDRFGLHTHMLGTTRQNFNAETGQIRSGMDGQSDAVCEPSLQVCITRSYHKTEQQVLTQTQRLLL